MSWTSRGRATHYCVLMVVDVVSKVGDIQRTVGSGAEGCSGSLYHPCHGTRAGKQKVLTCKLHEVLQHWPEPFRLAMSSFGWGRSIMPCK